ncbi:MAG: glycosyltransferase family 87 protein [Candidatus Limnocylindrales bacterium]
MRIGLTIAGLIFCAVYLIVLLGGQGFLDAHAYWATDLERLYAGAVVGGRDAYLYSPAFAQLIAPLTGLPFGVFVVIWTALEVAGLLWLLRPLSWAWRVPFLLLASPELVSGNIHVFLAVAIAVGFRFPSSWAFVLLTKVTPGVGLLWFAVRREWRALAVALGTTALIAGASFLVAPQLWRDWLGVLLSNSGTGGVSELAIPLWARLPVAVAAVAWGALTGRRWTVPVAATLAVPALYLHTLTMLLAIIPIELDPWTNPANRLNPPAPATSLPVPEAS